MQDFRHPNEFITFLLIGAQKAGTTWIHEVLNQHPDIYLPDEKETHFFDDADLYAKGLKHYASRFESMTTESHAGECTPDYLWTIGTEFERKSPDYLLNTAERISKVLPDIQLIVSLRNPIDRAISAFHHHRTRGRIPLNKSLKDVWFDLGLVSAGWYDRQLKEWYRFYDPSRFLILIFKEDIVPTSRKRATIDRVCNHIGATPIPDTVDLEIRANDRLNPAMSLFNRVPVLKNRYRGQRLAQKIDSLLPEPVQRWIDYDVTDSDVDFLRNEFGPHNEALETLLGRKLPW